jgi:hypothetical protein
MTDLHFTDDQIRESLAINSPALVQQLYQEAHRRCDEELKRAQRLDHKAAWLLSWCSLAMLIMVVLLLDVTLKRWIQVGLLTGALDCFAGTCFAMWAYRVQDGCSVADGALFNPELLKNSNTIADEAGEPLAEQYGLMTYQKSMIPHLMKVVHLRQEISGGKATWVFRAQKVFVLSLLTMFLGVLVSL